MIINHNTSAVNTNRILNNNTAAVKKSMEKVSSGNRINRAGDDAAGLAVSDKINVQVRGLAQASRNTSHAINFIQTTEGFINELTDILGRMKELSVQAATGTYSDEDRQTIQIEVEQLSDEINRISEQAQYNKMNMLSPRSGEQNFRTAEELGMQPAKINTPQDLQEAQGSWTLRVHVGANSDEAIAVNIYATDVNNLFAVGEGDAAGQGGATSPLALTTAVDANASIGKVDQALKVIHEQKANLGAFQNRLESVKRSTDYAIENLSESESVIRNANMANEMVELTKNNILTQAATSMLAQANQVPQNVLRLLQ